MATKCPKKHFIAFGPAIPTVPLSHFDKHKFTEEQLAGIWNIVGPSVERNLPTTPLWKVIAFAYMEGLSHGAAMQQEKETNV